MSLTKQILLGVLATITLIIFGVGSYYASTTLFPDPTNATKNGVTPTPTTTSSVPTISDMKRLNPQSMDVKKDGEKVTIGFTTAEEVGSMVYVTPNKSEKIAQVMKDYGNGVAISGRWYIVTADSKKGTTHELVVDKNTLSATAENYYFVVISYKKYWLPYGTTTDYINGLAEPYSFKL